MSTSPTLLQGTFEPSQSEPTMVEGSFEATPKQPARSDVYTGDMPKGFTDYDKASQALIDSKMLKLTPSQALQSHEVINQQLEARGLALSRTMPHIAADIKHAGQNSIFGLSYRNKLPDTLQDQGMFDEFVTGLSTMVADLPFYVAGAVGGAAAGSEVPVVGNIAGGAMGTFAVPAAIRKSLILGIQKGDIKSFGDLMERTAQTTYAGIGGAAIGLATEWAGGGTIPLKLLGGAAKYAEPVLKRLQQSAALSILGSLSEGRMPTVDDFAVNTALLLAMHYSLGEIEKVGPLSAKLQTRVQDAYVASGVHPREIAAEALRQAQTAPDTDVNDRVAEITRQEPQPDAEKSRQAAATATQPAGEAPEPTQPPPASLRPAIRHEDGTVTPGGEGETHPDIVGRTEGGERGFQDRKGNFLTREEAKERIKETEPNVYRHWEQVAGGPDAEFHTTDYNEALRRSTGIKNAAVDAQRAQAGLPPIESPTRSLDPDNWEQAKQDVDSGRVDPLAVAESINKYPRGLSPEETNALNYYRARLSNDHKTVMDAIDKAKADDDPQAEQRARDALTSVEDKINTVDEATKKAGTEWGLTGRMRQRMVAEDYSLDRLLQRARIASPNGEVSKGVRDNLESLTRQLEVANKKLDEHLANQSKQRAQQTVDNLKQEGERTQRKTTRVKDRQTLDSEFSDLVKEFDSLIMGRMSANPFFDPEVIGLLGKMAINRIAVGVTHIDDIVDYVHEQLTDIGHDVTKRDIRDAISGYGKTVEMSKDSMKVALREAKAQGKLLSALEDAQEGIKPLKSGLQRDKASERVQELRKQVNQAVRESGISSKSPVDALARYKKYLGNRIGDLERMLETGEFNREPQKRTVLDPEATEMKLKAEKLRGQIDDAIKKQELAKRTTTEKAVDFFTKWRRAALLTSWHVLGKLQTAAMLRMGVTPTEELTGGVLSQVPGIRDIADRAPSQGGGLNVSGAAKALSQFWQKATADDIWETLKTGKTSLDSLYGTKLSLPPEALDFIGHLHGALKVIPKRAEFFYRVEKISQWALDHNLDIDDPRVQTAILAKSYLESQRAILMQDNVATRAYNGMLSILHNAGPAGKALEAAGRFIFPIVKVPTNFIAESLAYTPGGLAWQSLQLFKILTDKDRMNRSAIDNLSMHDMDNVMRGLKKGSIGLALFALGFGLRKNVTGYYREGKKRTGDAVLGSIKVAGVEIPAWLAESPALAALQLGATTGNVWDHYNMKGMSGGFIAGLGYGTAGIVKRTPFIDETARLADAARSPESLSVQAGELTGNLLIPLIASQYAESQDPAGYNRKAKTFSQAIELQVPGLRERVPQSGSRPRFKKGF